MLQKRVSSSFLKRAIATLAAFVCANLPLTKNVARFESVRREIF